MLEKSQYTSQYKYGNVTEHLYSASSEESLRSTSCCDYCRLISVRQCFAFGKTRREPEFDVCVDATFFKNDRSQDGSVPRLGISPLLSVETIPFMPFCSMNSEADGIPTFSLLSEFVCHKKITGLHHCHGANDEFPIDLTTRSVI